MTTPTPPWESGPAPRQYDPTEHYYECANCSTKVTRNDSYPCSGSDTCAERVCEDCKQECAYCSLPACSEHMKRTSANDTACDECIKHEGIETLAEAERHEYAIAKRRGEDV